MLKRIFCFALMLCLCLCMLPVVGAAETEVAVAQTEGNITLPATVDGKVVLSWTVDGEVKMPGDVVDASATRKAKLFHAPVTSGVNSVKITSEMEETGIRFTADVNRADFEALVALYGERAISYGMLIAPDEYVRRTNGVFTREALRAMLEEEGHDPAKAFVQVNAGAFFYTDDTTLTIAGSLYSFSNVTYGKNPAFTAIAFIDIDSDNDGQTDMTVYGDYAPMASHTAVTILLGGRASATDTQKGWLDTILDRFQAYTPDYLLCVHELTAISVKMPSCTAAGVRAHYVCGLCGEHFSDETAIEHLPLGYANVPALGHSYENDFCVRCDICQSFTGGLDYEVPDIDWDIIGGADDHYHTLVFVPAKASTCSERGNLAHYYCAGCGKCSSDAAGQEVLENVALPLQQHSYENGFCTVCGATMAPGLYQSGTTTLSFTWDELVQIDAIRLEGTTIVRGGLADTYLTGDLVLAANITGIDAYAFSRCNGLTSVTIPASVVSISASAFDTCNNLSGVYFANTNGWTAGGDVLSDAALSDPATAAEYLKNTYVDKAWAR